MVLGKKKNKCQALWLIPIILAPMRLRQEVCHEFWARRSYEVNSSSAWLQSKTVSIRLTKAKTHL